MARNREATLLETMLVGFQLSIRTCFHKARAHKSMVADNFSFSETYPCTMRNAEVPRSNQLKLFGPLALTIVTIAPNLGQGGAEQMRINSFSLWIRVAGVGSLS